MTDLPDKRSAKDHGPYSAYCKVCWNPVFILWIDDEPPPDTYPLGAAKATECADVIERADLTAKMRAAHD